MAKRDSDHRCPKCGKAGIEICAGCGKPSPSQAIPVCDKHKCQMQLQFFTRPGSPPGNRWSCPHCAEQRAFEKILEQEIRNAQEPRQKKVNMEWKPGMLAEHFDEIGKRVQFTVEAVGGRYLHDRHGSSYYKRNCRPIFPSREPKSTPPVTVAVDDKTFDVYPADLFSGPHWDSIEKGGYFENSTWAACVRDLRDLYWELKAKLEKK